MVASLHSTAQPQQGLLEVLRLAEAEFRMNELPAFSIEHRGVERIMEPSLHDEISRICREAVANAFRHANAKHVRVFIDFEPHALHVEVSDDGVGMDASVNANGRVGHFGLPSMRARSQRIGAELEIESATGMGTTVRLRIRSSWLERVRFWMRVQRLRRREQASQGDLHD